MYFTGYEKILLLIKDKKLKLFFQPAFCSNNPTGNFKLATEFIQSKRLGLASRPGTKD